ncbi:hypothetical protein L4C38_06845 [Vibrio kasasachensis]|uniref:hypothetical protein n=1 Tax=Vibrio kasasachensis TaxID=2910248 RepID=UPI003D0E8790
MNNITLKKAILPTLATCAVVAGGLALSPSYSPYDIEKPEVGELNLTVKNINWCFRNGTVKNYLYTNSKPYNDKVKTLKKSIHSDLEKRCEPGFLNNPNIIKLKLGELVARLNYFSFRDEAQTLLESVGSQFTKYNKFEDYE